MTHPELQEAKQALELLSADPKARQRAEKRAIWQLIYNTDLAHERQDGLKKGRKQGLLKGRKQGLLTAIETACELLAVDITRARRAQLESASVLELKELLGGLKEQRHWPR